MQVIKFFLLLVLTGFISVSARADYSSKKTATLYLSSSLVNDTVFSDTDLVLKIVFADGKRVLQISFNGSEGSEGDMKLYDIDNEVVKEANFELIKSPFYASVDISGLKQGTYNIELATKIKIHTDTLVVK